MAGGMTVRLEYSEAFGLGYEPGITRRDPSCVIRASGMFHVWYTKIPYGPSGYDATVWHAHFTGWDAPGGERRGSSSRIGRGVG